MKKRYVATGLRPAIDQQGRQLAWLAAQAGVSRSLLTHVLAGRRTVGEETASRIALLLGVPVPFLFAEVRRDSSQPR